MKKAGSNTARYNNLPDGPFTCEDTKKAIGCAVVNSLISGKENDILNAKAELPVRRLHLFSPDFMKCFL